MSRVKRLPANKRGPLISQFKNTVDEVRNAMNAIYTHMYNLFILNQQGVLTSATRFALVHSLQKAKTCVSGGNEVAVNMAIVLEEASDIYREFISKLLKELSTNVSGMQGRPFLTEVHSIWNKTKAAIKVYDVASSYLNVYLKDYGNNTLEDDHPLTRKSNVVAEGVKILRDNLIVKYADKIGKCLVEEIDKLRRDEYVEENILEDMFQAYVICDLGDQVGFEFVNLGSGKSLKFVKKEVADNAKQYITSEITDLVKDKSFKSQLLIKVFNNPDDDITNIQRRTKDFYNLWKIQRSSDSIDQYLVHACRILDLEEKIIKKFFLSYDMQQIIKTQVSNVLIVEQIGRLIVGSKASNSTDGCQIIFDKLLLSDAENKQQGLTELAKLYSLFEKRIMPDQFFYDEGYIPNLDNFVIKIDLFVNQLIIDCSISMSDEEKDVKKAVVEKTEESVKLLYEINTICFNSNPVYMNHIKKFLKTAICKHMSAFSFYLICVLDQRFIKNEWEKGLNLLKLLEFIENKVEAITLYRLALQYRILTKRNCNSESERSASQMMRKYCTDTGDELTSIDNMINDWNEGRKIKPEMTDYLNKKGLNSDDVENFDACIMKYSVWEDKTSLRKAYTDSTEGVPDIIKDIDTKWKAYWKEKDSNQLLDVQWDQQHSTIHARFVNTKSDIYYLIFNIPQMKILETIDKAKGGRMKWEDVVSQLGLKQEYENPANPSKEEKANIKFLKENIRLLYKHRGIIKVKSIDKEGKYADKMSMLKAGDIVMINKDYKPRSKIKTINLCWNEVIEDIDMADFQEYIDGWTLHIATEHMRIIMKTSVQIHRDDLLAKSKKSYDNAILTHRKWGKVFCNLMEKYGEEDGDTKMVRYNPDKQAGGSEF